MTVVPTSMAFRRLEIFKRKCAGLCGSKKQFDRNFDVDESHIIKAGILKNQKRLALETQDIAAVIQQGTINQATSDDTWPIQIAIDGKILNYAWTAYTGPGAIEARMEPFVHVRVVVKQNSPRNKVITAYIIEDSTAENLPEVKREIW